MMELAPDSNRCKLLRLCDAMTIIKQGIKTQNLRQEVQQLRATAKRLAATKESARRFLISTGMYSTNGEIKPQYR